MYTLQAICGHYVLCRMSIREEELQILGLLNSSEPLVLIPHPAVNLIESKHAGSTTQGMLMVILVKQKIP